MAKRKQPTQPQADANALLAEAVGRIQSLEKANADLRKQNKAAATATEAWHDALQVETQRRIQAERHAKEWADVAEHRLKQRNAVARAAIGAGVLGPVLDDAIGKGEVLELPKDSTGNRGPYALTSSWRAERDDLTSEIRVQFGDNPENVWRVGNATAVSP